MVLLGVNGSTASSASSTAAALEHTLGSHQQSLIAIESSHEHCCTYSTNCCLSETTYYSLQLYSRQTHILKDCSVVFKCDSSTDIVTTLFIVCVSSPFFVHAHFPLHLCLFPLNPLKFPMHALLHISHNLLFANCLAFKIVINLVQEIFDLFIFSHVPLNY